MSKLIGLILFFIVYFLGFSSAQASENAFVTVVNPIRGEDFWQEQGQEIATAVSGQLTILKEFNVSATWLIRFDALDNKEVLDVLNTRLQDEKGLFLEVTPSWANEAGISYNQSDNWHAAGSAFLSGYKREERVKLIDSAFEKFKEVFNFYPKSVGAWWIDSFSLEYIQKKYNIIASLEVSDQYTTDDYQIWGQFWSTPYYPAKNNVLHPAQSKEDKLPVVVMQWAARDPVNGYGNGVFESTFSVQANDYLDYHKLNTNYFSSLVDIYTKGQLNSFGHLTVGLENSYSFEKYGSEYRKQIGILVNKQRLGQLKIVTMKDFASWYTQSFPDLSPEHLIVADDPLGKGKKAIWFMNPYYRAGILISSDGSIFRDIRQYVGGEEELCYLKACSEVNFATFATRVLDNVTYGHKWIIDEGKISQIKIVEENESFVVNYINEALNERRIEFLKRDISIDGKSGSIDGRIIEATEKTLQLNKDYRAIEGGFLKWSALNFVFKTLKFLTFLFLAVLIPGFVFMKFSSKDTLMLRIFLSLITGLVIFTLLSFISGILKFQSFIWVYILVSLIFFIRLNLYKLLKIEIPKINFLTFISLGIIFAGTIFQVIPTFRSGLEYEYGIGFWGPNTHDGVWHIALINALKIGIPPQNPIFANEIFKNYHYFYDLLIASTSSVFKIPTLDLVFRFYPVVFSLFLGIGTYYLIGRLFKEKYAQIFGLFFVYFGGSFGWVIDVIKNREIGGESHFWANQSISFNLNPPFAISLLIVIAIIQLLPNLKSKSSIFTLTILAGTLISFKAYAAILVLISLVFVGIIKRNRAFILVFIFSAFVSAALFLSNFSLNTQLIIFSPFWFIHSMIDSPDRVGWIRLSLARVAGFEQSNWFKFLAAEAISLVIFIAGNMGMRVFALFSLIKIKIIFKEIHYLFLFIFSALSVFIPILFIQAGNPWNTIQFLYYFLYVSAVAGGVVFSQIFTKIPKVLLIIVVAIFLIVTPISSLTTAKGYIRSLPHAYISSKELEALKFLESKEKGIILTYPYDKRVREIVPEPLPLFIYDSTAYVSAFSKKSVFLEDEPQNQILLTDYKKRIVASRNFFEISNSQKFKFLEKNKIRYIYLPKIFNIKFDEKEKVLEKIFENEEVVIYKVIE